MNSITCLICGTKKNAANRWWVLFEAASGRAVVIGPIEEAETLSQWQQGMTRYHLCGAECLYRKLHGTLHPAVAASSGKKPGTEAPGDNGREAGAASRNGASGQASSGRNLPIPLPGFLRRAADLKRSSSELPSDGPASRNEKSPARLRQIAAIQEGVTIKGRLQSDESLYVNGELVGTVELPGHRLTVGPNGKIRADVQAREVEVLGMIEGDVRADKIVVRKNAALVGNIWTVVLVIEEGAFFDGRCSKASARDTAVTQRREAAIR